MKTESASGLGGVACTCNAENQQHRMKRVKVCGGGRRGVGGIVFRRGHLCRCLRTHVRILELLFQGLDLKGR